MDTANLFHAVQDRLVGLGMELAGADEGLARMRERLKNIPSSDVV